ncbi:unnamed protein product [Allacma fusca]|uniref:Fe2OG dioxygenase domain-containing protein n=1 Tax=Allacma fusca TaxID=39272 RepID=A0A8J2K964_9HEXA|nr:unnamed protein product [Allacma fusca]
MSTETRTTFVPYWDLPQMYAKSVPDLKSLERFDLEIVKQLTHTFLATEMLPRGSEIRRLAHAYLQDYYESNGKLSVRDAIDNFDNRLSRHPICTYRLIRRVVYLLGDLLSEALQPYWTSTLKNWINSSIFWTKSLKYFPPEFPHTVHNFSQHGWLKAENLEIWAEKILRLQHVYNLDPIELAKGWVSYVPSNCTLNSIHCWEISKIATRTDQFANAIQWLELARKRASVDKKLSLPFIEFAFWDAIEIHNLGFDDDIKMELGPWYFDRVISHVPGASQNATKLRDLQYEAFRGNKDKFYSAINYLGICSGDNFKTSREKSKLFCWQEFKIHPSFLIGPMKMEFLSQNPDIIQMYGVLGEEEMESIKSESVIDMRLEDNLVIGYDRAPFTFTVSSSSYHRSLLQSWCKFSKGRDLEKKLERLTGWVVEGQASEVLTVGAYSPGGHLHTHFDRPSSNDALHNSNTSRIITATFYLNDVEVGGRTAFTSAGVGADPIKGSLTLWFNVHNDGTEDFDTYHGGCPLLIGEKWVGNKWVKYAPQFSKGKCGLKPKEKYQFPVNNVYLPVQG